MAVEKAIASSSLVEVIDRILDKGVVVDAWLGFLWWVSRYLPLKPGLLWHLWRRIRSMLRQSALPQRRRNGFCQALPSKRA